MKLYDDLQELKDMVQAQTTLTTVQLTTCLRVACRENVPDIFAFLLDMVLDTKQNTQPFLSIRVAYQTAGPQILRSLRACFDSQSTATPFQIACIVGNLELVELWIKTMTVDDIKANDNRAFQYACFHGQTAIVRALIPHLTIKDMITNANGALNYAVMKGYSEVVQLLLQHIPIRHVIANKNDIFYEACAGGDVATVELLYKTIPPKKLKIQHLKYGLYEACRCGHVALVQFFIRILPLSTLVRSNALLAACDYSRLEVVDVLLPHFPLHDMVTVLKQKYLLKACRYGILSIAKLLCSDRTNVDIKFDNNRPFRIACRFGCLKVVEYLFQFLDATEIRTCFAFRKACFGGHLRVVQYLLRFLSVDDIRADNNIAFKKSCTNIHAKVAVLLSPYLTPEDILQDGKEIFHKACGHGTIATVRFLYELLPQDFTRDNRALILACKFRRYCIFEFLVRLRSADDLRADDYCVLKFVCKRCDTRFITCLLNVLTAEDVRHSNALQLAVKFNNRAVVAFFLSVYSNDCSNTPIDMESVTQTSD